MIMMARTPSPMALALLGMACLLGLAQGGEVSFPRQPALSPDGEQLAFCWRGDLWVSPSGGGTGAPKSSR